MSKASTASKLIKIDLNEVNNLVSVTNLDLGFDIKYELKQLKSEKNSLIHEGLILNWGLNNFWSKFHSFKRKKNHSNLCLLVA